MLAPLAGCVSIGWTEEGTWHTSSPPIVVISLGDAFLFLFLFLFLAQSQSVSHSVLQWST
jgi:hypothetical protein